MSDDYEVGYGKPPKEHRFKRRDPDAPPVKRGPRRAAAADLNGLLDKPITVERKGRSIKLHPHEAMMTMIGTKAVQGEMQAIKLFLAECEKAGLLDKPPTRPHNGVLTLPRDIPARLGQMLTWAAGTPPWPPSLITNLKAEYVRTRTPLEVLYDDIAGFKL